MTEGPASKESALDAIVERQRQALASASIDAGRLHAMAEARGEPRDLAGALIAGPEPALIAECKRRSPVAGLIAEDYDVAAIARAYDEGGASALSILTNDDFDGRQEHLAEAWGAVSLPLLAKDFVIDPIQLLQARAHGADCALLIARILSPESMTDLIDRAHELGMQVLLEVHDEAEVDAAVAAAPDLIGVNHRNLETFDIDSDLLGRIVSRLPAATVVVAESGFERREQVVAAGEAGARAVLVGTSLMRAPDPAAKVRELLGKASGQD